MDTKPEALEYAILLEEAAGDYCQFDDHLGRDAAALLRSQHASIEELERALATVIADCDAAPHYATTRYAPSICSARALLTKKD